MTASSAVICDAVSLSDAEARKNVTQKVIRPHVPGDLAERVVGMAERFRGKVERVVIEVLARDRQFGLRLAQGIDMAGARGERALGGFAFALREDAQAGV